MIHNDASHCSVSCRYSSEAQSSAAGDSMHGLPIARAMLAADAAQPPALSFTQRSCLTFTVQQPAPLLYLRPAGHADALAVPPVPDRTAAELFTDWSAAQRHVGVPAALFVGELAPLPLVISRRKGQSATALRFASASGDVAVLANVSVADMQQPPPEQLVSMHDRFGDSAGDGNAADASVSTYDIDADAQQWTASEGGYEHLPVTIWLHPQRVGTLRLRLLLAYEGERTALRTARLALDVPVLPALVPGAVSAKPLAGTLAAWQVQFPVSQADAVASSPSLGGGSFTVDSVALRSQYWALHGSPAADPTVAVEGASALNLKELDAPVPVDGAWRQDVALALTPLPLDGGEVSSGGRGKQSRTGTRAGLTGMMLPQVGKLSSMIALLCCHGRSWARTERRLGWACSLRHARVWLR